MELFWQSIKQRRRGILSGVAFGLIFMISFALYQLPVQAVIYPMVLCSILGLLLLVIDFRRIRQKHRLLESIRDITDMITTVLPEPDGVEDKDYQRILELLKDAHIKYRTDTEQRYLDMVDYYTVWAHQIKTPIASMRLHLQNEDSSLSRQLSGELFRVEQYVEMVLTFLRLDAASTDYVIREYDLDTIVRQAVKKYAGEFINRKISLRYEPLDTSVITDEKWLSFVIEQVLSNALKYTIKGSITIYGEADRLCIRDTGMGIAPEDLPRIFENGYTGYNGRRDKKASGIGLYLCKRICNNLGHRISASSVLDEGTLVTIDLARDKLEVE